MQEQMSTHRGCGELWGIMNAAMATVTWPYHMPYRRYAEMLRIETGIQKVHYEVEATRQVVKVGLHFERNSREQNQRLLDLVAAHQGTIHQGIIFEYESDRSWRGNWAYIRFLVPYRGLDQQAVVRQVISTMRTLIERTWPLIEPILTSEQ